jgi:hypothetical protein
MKTPMLSRARDEFSRAHRKAVLQKTLASITHRSIELLPYDEVRSQLKFSGSAHRGVEEIPIHKIVGSVGRYQDFTRDFLPTNQSDELRWAQLRTYMEENSVPPIDVYKVGEAYFVIDGNHRISISRILQREFITAYVTEIKTRVPLTHHDTPQQVIAKARYAEFLEATNLDQIRPGSDLQITFLDQYDLLLSQIEVNRYFMWKKTEQEYLHDEVVADWYDQHYLPIVQIIRENQLNKYFPDQTEADLYLLLTEHRHDLEKVMGQQVGLPEAAASLSQTRKAPSISERIKLIFRKFF